MSVAQLCADQTDEHLRVVDGEADGGKRGKVRSQRTSQREEGCRHDYGAHQQTNERDGDRDAPCSGEIAQDTGRKVPMMPPSSMPDAQYAGSNGVHDRGWAANQKYSHG